MWLLLVAAGTGYLVRYWQKSRKFKTGTCLYKCNATINFLQESPLDTPRRRGRLITLGRRGFRRPSQSTKRLGRNLFHRMVGTTHARGLDDDSGFSDKVSDHLLCTNNFFGQCDSDHGTSGQEQTSSLLFCTHETNHYELLKKSLLPNADIVANENSTDNASLVTAPVRQLVLAVPACSGFLSSKVIGGERRHGLPLKLKKLTENGFHFITKVARGFGHRTCSTLLSRTNGSPNLKPIFSLKMRDVHVSKYSSYGNIDYKTLSEEKKKEQKFGGFLVHSQKLKTLFDPEFLEHCKRWNFLPSSSSMARVSLVDNVSGDWVHAFETASQFANPASSFGASNLEPLCSRENDVRSFNEISYVALGLAMGVLLVATSCSNELEDLHMLLRKNITLVQELRKEIDSRFEPDSSKLPEVEKVPSAHSNMTCSQKVHSHPEVISWPSRGQKDSVKLFKASINHEANESREFGNLEAELEAELQLLALNGCSFEQVDFGSRWTEHCQNNWLPEGDENGFVDKPEEDELSCMDINIHNPQAVEDAGQLYDSDFVIPPLELERRLWQVLEQRHEERICELENDLRVSQETITAKELEVQWWKDRVRWLIETSPKEKSEDLHPGCTRF
ncbi:hypothetical protein L7F22_040375 [Adiantum nelumboides]|nr:hypothetical protein [Adiantum nelumboides]